MRTKFLSILATFFVFSAVISSCLDSDEVSAYSTDTSIYAFGLDEVLGRHYQFTIDQMKREIYNRDSMPVGSDTILDRILIDTLSVGGWVTGGLKDTLVSTTDSVDLISAISKYYDTDGVLHTSNGVKLKVHAADDLTTREYTLKINVHTQHPDSLVWKDMADEGEVFTTETNPGKQRAIILGEDLWVYTSHTQAYKTSTELNQYAWSSINLTGLPADAILTSVINFNGKLYMTTDSKQVFGSEDGSTWSQATELGSNVTALIAVVDSKLSAIVEIDGKQYFNTTTDGQTWDNALATDLNEVEDGFPTANIYAASNITDNGLSKVVVMGMPYADGAQALVPWFTLDGKQWADLGTTSDKFFPALDQAAIMYYGGQYCAFGGNLKAMYTSVNAIAWFEVEERFLLDEHFLDKGSFSMAIDNDHFIWMVFGGNDTPNEVWRGRLNRLGFELQ